MKTKTYKGNKSIDLMAKRIDETILKDGLTVKKVQGVKRKLKGEQVMVMVYHDETQKEVTLTIMLTSLNNDLTIDVIMPIEEGTIFASIETMLNNNDFTESV